MSKINEVSEQSITTHTMSRRDTAELGSHLINSKQSSPSFSSESSYDKLTDK